MVKNLCKTDEKVPILSAIAKGAITNKVLAGVLKKSNSTIHRKLKNLEKQGLIQKIGYPHIIELTARGRVYLTRKKPELKHNFSQFSLGTGKKTRTHRIIVKVPITKDHSDNSIWDKVNKKFKNTTIYYKKELPHPDMKITIAKVGSSSILIFLHEKEFNRGMFVTHFMQYAWRAFYFAKHYLWQKGIYVDELEVEITQQHIANPEPEMDDKVDKKVTMEFDLGRKSKGVFPTDEDAKVWLDHSKGPLEFETNDMAYAEKAAMMPEKVFEIGDKQALFASNLEHYNNSLKVYNENIKLHMSVMKDMRTTLRKIQEGL